MQAPHYLSRSFLCGVVTCLLPLASGLVSAANEASSESAVVAVYHHVSTATPPSTSLSPSRFLEHLELLRDEGHTVMALPTLLEAFSQKQALPDRATAITFDDGYDSVFTTAFPLLQRAGYPFSVFISTGPIDREQRGYLTWEQLRTLVAAGVTIGNHGTEHRSLIEMSGDEIRRDTKAAQARIDAELGAQPKLFAYPYGEFSLEAKQVLSELGYRAFAQNSGAIGFNSDQLALPRFPLAGRYAGLEGAKLKYSTLAFDVATVRNINPITQLSAPQLELDFKEGDFSADRIACFDSDEALTTRRSADHAGRLLLQPTERSRGRRWHYICTAPQRSTGRYYWYSQPWFDPRKPQN